MPICYADCETYSHLSVKDVGAFRYALDPSTEIILWGLMPEKSARALTFETPDIYAALEQLRAEKLLTWGKKANPLYILHWTPFDRLVQHRCGLEFSDPIPGCYGVRGPHNTIWVDLAELAATVGWPGKLENSASWVGVESKAPGKALINYFCGPDENGERRLPASAPGRWESFRAYCAQDVQVMRSIYARLAYYGVDTRSHIERSAAVRRMNARGVCVDARAASLVHTRLQTAQEDADREVESRYGFKTSQVKAAAEFIGLPNLQADTVEAAIAKGLLDDDQKFVAEVRLGLAGAARRKLSKVSSFAVAHEDHDRVHGGFLYHGAWTGRLTSLGVQLQNMVREPSHEEFFAGIEGMTDAELFAHTRANIRGFFRAKPGHTLVAADFKGIELAVGAWLADEKWLVDLLDRGGDPYVRAAARDLSIAESEVTKAQRQDGKTIELGMMYQLSGAGFYKQLTKRGVQTELWICQRSCDIWREAHPAFVKGWGKAFDAFLDCIESSTGSQVWVPGMPIELTRHDDYICATRPSGARMYYWMPTIGASARGEEIRLWQKGDAGVMFNGHTYGGHLFQGWVQGTAYDLMIEALVRCGEDRVPVVLSIHDELVAEVPVEDAVRQKANLVLAMKAGKPWTEGIPVSVSTWVSDRFTKD